MKRESGLERLIMFSDGVFAIAITLLILDVRLPAGAPTEELGSILWDMRPTIGAYVLSFWVIGIYWQAHRRIFAKITSGDSTLMTLNLAYLMAIAFLPFPTSVLAEYESTRDAAIFYASVHVLIGILGASMSIYALKHQQVHEDVTPQEIRSGFVRALIPVFIFSASIVVALVSETSVPFIWFGLFLVGPLQRLLKTGT